MRDTPGAPVPDRPPLLDWERLERDLPDVRRRFRASADAPHVVLDGFLHPARLAESGLVAAVRALGFSGAVTEYRSFNTRSAATEGDALPPPVTALIRELHGPRFLAYLEDVTGFRGLVADHDLANGGVHFMRPGGYLRLHRDEYVHPDRPTLRRRLNLLVYLNEAWQESYGGHLELRSADGERPVAAILPVCNRCVITAIEHNVHGVPAPVRCPPDDLRKTVILWYYTDEGRAVDFEPAVFVRAPGDGLLRGLLIDAESRLFGLYHGLRRRHRALQGAALTLMRRVGYGRVPRRAPRGGEDPLRKHG